MNEITENYAIIESKKYIPAKRGDCRGCSFVRGDVTCGKLKCGYRIRKDKRNVIWVEDTTYNLSPKRTLRLLKP